MYWPKFSEKKLRKLLRSRRRAENGCECTYVKWTKHVGLKLYGKKKLRNYAVRAQKRAAKVGLGPKVGENLVELEVISWYYTEGDMEPELELKKLYGYFTEHMPPIKNGRWEPWEESQLYGDLQKQGIYHGDLHEGNVSRRKGVAYCIDFGSESCYMGRRAKKKIIPRSNLDMQKFFF